MHRQQLTNATIPNPFYYKRFMKTKSPETTANKSDRLMQKVKTSNNMKIDNKRKNHIGYHTVLREGTDLLT